ncbi:hypothetical protein T265_01759 [Opisthorchis viverrini]|uniref:Protein kinase domain-containing protein n=1 Tax=Opisthorchis viverrini TaxID=6198 RepID=A0A075AIS4_OPIVI|nr:hypothetical protein T265_01759 [Opisthorchis viverrini]KER32139.1 hypothetical protein T265_01759 [Opisthorchis viverrini]
MPQPFTQTPSLSARDLWAHPALWIQLLYVARYSKNYTTYLTPAHVLHLEFSVKKNTLSWVHASMKRQRLKIDTPYVCGTEDTSMECREVLTGYLLTNTIPKQKMSLQWQTVRRESGDNMRIMVPYQTIPSDQQSIKETFQLVHQTILFRKSHRMDITLPEDERSTDSGVSDQLLQYDLKEVRVLYSVIKWIPQDETYRQYRIPEERLSDTILAKSSTSDSFSQSHPQHPNVKKLPKECRIIQQLKHPNIVTFIRTIMDEKRMMIGIALTPRRFLAAISPEGATKAEIPPSRPNPDRSLNAGVHRVQIVHRDINPNNLLRTTEEQIKYYRSAVAPFRCLAAMPHEEGTKAGIPPGCPNLDRGIREAEVGSEPRTFQSVNSRSNHLVHPVPGYYGLSGNTFLITDFGLSEEYAEDRPLRGTIGTPQYLAPECVKEPGEPYDGKPVDVWALGMTLYWMIQRENYYDGENKYDIFEKIQREPVVVERQVEYVIVMITYAAR